MLLTSTSTLKKETRVCENDADYECCGERTPIKTEYGTVCANCGLMLDECYITDNSSHHIIRDVEKNTLQNETPIIVHGMAPLYAVNDIKSNGNLKYIRLNKAQQKTKEFSEQEKMMRYFSVINRCCQNLELPRNIKLCAQDILVEAKKGGFVFENKTVRNIALSALFFACKSHGMRITIEQLLDSIKSDIDENPNNRRKKNLWKIISDMSKHANYLYDSDRYDPLSITLSRLMPIKFEDGTVIRSDEFSKIKDVSNRIYNLARNYGASEINKTHVSIYFAIILLYDIKPVIDEIDKCNQVVNKFQELLRIKLIYPQTKSNLILKYHYYKKNIKRSYVILRRGALEHVLNKTLNKDIKNIPKIFYGASGNNYHYDDKKKKFVFEIYDYRIGTKTIEMDKTEFIEILNGNFALNLNENKIAVLSFLKDADILNLKKGSGYNDYVVRTANSLISFLLDTSDDKFIKQKNKNKNAEHKIKVKNSGNIRLSKSTITFRPDTINSIIVETINGDKVKQKYYYKNDAFINAILSIQNNSINPKNRNRSALVDSLIELLIKIGVVVEQDNNYHCNAEISNILLTIDQILVS